jgi:hypothetical protein
MSGPDRSEPSKDHDAQPPAWARAPLRVLRRAYRFMHSTDVDDWEDALIHSDRAIEVAVGSYVGLPERVRKRQVPREMSERARSSKFPEKLAFLEWYLDVRGEPHEQLLNDAAHYHSLRNPAYHASTGFIPAADDVEGAFNTALTVFRALFGFDPLPALRSGLPVDTSPNHTPTKSPGIGRPGNLSSPEADGGRGYRRRPGNLEQLMARADDWNVGRGVRALIAAAEGCGLVQRVTYNSVNFYSPSDRRISLLIIGPDWHGGGRVLIYLAQGAAFERDFPWMSGPEHDRLFGPENKRVLSGDDGIKFAGQIRRALRCRDIPSAD